MKSQKTVLITGSTDGIGKESAIKLVNSGYYVIIHGRNQQKVLDTIESITLLTNKSDLSYIIGDLNSFSQIKEMTTQLYEEFDHLDVLVNNAGVYRSSRIINDEGLEQTFAVNYIAPFLITYYLLDLLKKADNARIVNVVSQVHSNQLDLSDLQSSQGYTPVKAYALSKTCLIMFTYRLAERFRSDKMTFNCLHPGIINTKLLEAAMGHLGAPVEQAADYIYYAVNSPDLNNVSGKYLNTTKIEDSKSITYNKILQEQLWKKTEDITKIEFQIS
jgi:NAD(P)-dependent dehydrogenase (short-subunit alcohol dehydrogenase family)